jgi:iron(III) transport system permease protein
VSSDIAVRLVGAPARGRGRGGGRTGAVLLWVGLVAALGLLAAAPVLELVRISFEKPGLAFSGYTLANYAHAFGRARYLEAFTNSFILGASVATLSVLFTAPMAWAVTRTDMPGKRLVEVLVLLTFITPPFLGATSWVLLAAPNAGWLNKIYMWATGSPAGVLNIYSMPGIIFVIAIYSIPYTFTLVCSALELVSSEMEDAANILGAGRARTLVRITLPLVTPALIGAWILTFLEAISIVGSTVILALPARVNLIPLQLLQFFGYPLQVEVAAAFALPLVLLTIGLYGLQRRALHRRGYATLTGKGGERRPIRLGAGRFVLLGYCLGIAMLSVGLPYLVLMEAAFTRAWARGLAWSNLTTANFSTLLFDQSLLPQSLVNTFVYAFAAACLAVGLALVVAYAIARQLVPGGQVLATLCMMPFVVPGMVLAIGFYAAYGPPPLALAGTALILILAFTARFLPIAFTSASAALRGMNPEMEEAARISGASRAVVLRRIVAPLLRRGTTAVWMLVFIAATREVSSALFLYGPRTRTMSVLFFDLTEGGNFEQLAALGLIMAGTTLACVSVGRLFAGRDFMLRRN